jgi:protein-L-isoaspartate O-methyltransferase
MPVDPARRKESFDAEAEAYDRFRRPYPDEVFADLVSSAGIRAGSRVLEIAPGTGQLSVPLARLGVELVAVELGPSLAAIARRNLAPFPRASVEVGAFEEWSPPAVPFDAVVCATAFHWLDPNVRFARCAAALRPGGALAIISTHHVAGGSHAFHVESQRLYVGAGLAEDENFSPPAAEELPPSYPELDGDPAFTQVERTWHPIERHFTAAEYVGLLRTDSLVARVSEPGRQAFLDGIGQIIEERCGGEITRAFVHELIVARRAAPPD